MAAKKSSTRSNTGRSKGSSESPAQRRRRQEAAAAAAAKDQATRRRAARTPTEPAPHRSAPTQAILPRSTRDRILGWGAALGALLALMSLNVPALALFFGLLYAAVALLMPSERKQRQLAISAWAMTLWVLLSTLVLTVLVAVSSTDAGEASDDGTMDHITIQYGSLAIDLVSAVMLTLAAALIAAALSTGGSKRNRLFGWSGASLVAYFVLFLPSAVVDSSAAPAPGAFWDAPLVFGSILLGILAGVAIACAFLWREPADRESDTDGPSRYGFADREYLLSVAALSLLPPRLMSLIFIDWSSLRPSAEEAVSTAALQGVVALATLLLLPALFASAAVAFWVSARQSGWKPRTWLQPAILQAKARLPLPWLARFLLSWRLPLSYGWLLVLIVACSFLAWYGLLALPLAAAHYLRMLDRTRERHADVE